MHPGQGLACGRRRAGGVAARIVFAALGCAVALIAVVAATPVPAQPGHPAGKAVVLDIDGAIGPAAADYVVRGLRSAAGADAGAVVLRINTPGGLDSAMREIIAAILASPVPVIAYVAPGGARAASAGTYIVTASSIAAMAPTTEIGAATPVDLGAPSFAPRGGRERGQPGSGPDRPGDDAAADTHTRKMVNDAAAYIRGLAERHGRNTAWVEEAVRRAASVPAPEALRLDVIDVIADSVPELLRAVDGRSVRAGTATVTLMTAGLEVENMPPDWRTEALGIVTDPNVAFLLLLVGVYGLLFEFLSPGAVAPGVIGGLSLLVALYALELLPVNFAGAALLLFGIALMVVEAHVGGFGIIGLGGVAAFVIGAILMFPLTTLSVPVVATATAVSVLFFLVVLATQLRSRRRRVVTGGEALLGASGEVLSWQNAGMSGDPGRVRVGGEIWRARAPVPLAPGSRVRVSGRDGLTLVVTPEAGHHGAAKQQGGEEDR